MSAIDKPCIYKDIFHMVEIWKDIPSHAGYYQVSNIGRVKRLATVRTMRNQVTSWKRVYPELLFKPSLDSSGYYQVTLSYPTKRTARVHRLVAEAFLQEPSEVLKKECERANIKVFVNHKDLNKLNNCLSNLEWCSPSYNNLGTNKLALPQSGSKHYASILTEDAVREILNLRSTGISQQKLAEIYGVKQITISNILTGRSWRQVTGLPMIPRSTKKKALAIAESQEL